jgi:hypothetical protein
MNRKYEPEDVTPREAEQIYHDPEFDSHPVKVPRHKPKPRKEKRHEQPRDSKMPSDQDE